MQIHELDNYGGALDTGAYLAIDDGSDTGKVSAAQLLASTNARIDNIIAGGTAPSEAEVTDARLGAAALGSIPYDSLGNAIRGQVTTLEDDITSGFSENKFSIPLIWEVGDLDPDTGELLPQYTNFRSSQYINLEDHDIVNITNTFLSDNYIWVYYYDENQAYIERTQFRGDSSGTVTLIHDDGYIRIEVPKAVMDQVKLWERSVFVVKDSIENYYGDISPFFKWGNSPMEVGYNGFYNFEFEQGMLYNGNVLDRDYAIYTPKKMKFTEPMTVLRVGDTVWFYVTYSADGTYETTSNGITNSSYEFTPDSTKLYRFCIRSYDSSTPITVEDACNEVRFCKKGDYFNPQWYWMNPTVAVTAGGVQIYKTGSISVSVVFTANSSIWLNNIDGRSQAKKIDFNNKTEYSLNNGNSVLVWDVEANTIKVITSNNLTDKLAVLLRMYGGAPLGALAYHYIEQQKALTTYNYPPYYDDGNYLSDKIDTIRSNEQSIGTHGDSFVFVTDTHWDRNQKKSPALVRSIIHNTQLNKVVHGGDVPLAYQTEDAMYESVKAEGAAWRYAVGDYLFRMLGNHDIHTTDNSDPTNPYYELTSDEVYGLMLSEQENRVTYNDNNLAGGYFYFDNKVQKIRYICVNNFESPNATWMSNYQISWIADRVLELTEGWNVVFIGHCSIISAQTPEFASYTDLRDLISAIANKRSLTTSYGRELDFTNTPVTVIGYFAGHHHKDMLNVYDGVTYVVTTSDALFQDDGYSRAANTINEQAFDVIQINTQAKNVNLVRIGAGSDRSFTY